MVFHCHLFNTSGTLCAAACCHSASTSASGTVVLLHLTVSEAVTLQSGGTHHSAGSGLDVGAIFLWDIFQNTHSISLVDIIPLFQTDIHKNCDLKQDTITRTCLPPPSINDKRKKKSIHKMLLPLQSSLNRSNSIWRADRTSCSLYTSSYFCCTASPRTDRLSYVTGCSDLNRLQGWIRWKVSTIKLCAQYATVRGKEVSRMRVI